MKHKAPAIGPILFGLIVIALAQVSLVAQTATTKPKSVAPVANPCPRFSAGSVIHQPPVLSSSNGVLNVTFSFQSIQDSHGRFLFCFMTPDGLENPTLQVNPGDLLTITVTNNNTNPQGSMSMTLNAPNCGGPTDTNLVPTSLNIHYHGTNTSPMCGSDEVIKTIINTGETFTYNVQFPSNEPPGLYWYHPHVHGNAEQALLGGASGAIIVTGIQNVQPKVSELTQQVLVIRDQRQVQGIPEAGGPCTTNNIPFQDITVNNVPIDSNVDQNNNVTFTPAVFRYEESEPQFWRVTNSSSDTILDLQLTYDGVAQTIQIVGIDGVPVNSQDGTGPGSTIGVQDFRLPPASRVEFIANMPSRSVKLAQLTTQLIDTGSAGDCDPARPVFTLVRGDDAETRGAKLARFTHYDTTGQRFRGLASAPVAQSRLVYFDENPNTNQFFMAVQGQPEQVFNANAPPAIFAQQGTSEIWTVENHAQENHEFHFHQVHFLVQQQNNFTTNGHKAGPTAINGQYLDMIEVPGWNGVAGNPYPNVMLKIDYRGSDTGDFVFHCHILNHEDQGMMNIINVSGGDSKNRTKPADVAKDAGKDATAQPAKPAAMHMHSEPETAPANPGGGGRH